MRNVSSGTRKSLKEELDRLALRMTLTDDPEELTKLRKKIEDISSVLEPQLQVSGDAILAASVNILGILLVLNYEKLDVITTRAFGMLSRTRV